MKTKNKTLDRIKRLHARQNALAGKIAWLSDDLKYRHAMYEWKSEKERKFDEYLIHFIEAAYADAEKAEGNLGAVINIALD